MSLAGVLDLSDFRRLLRKGLGNLDSTDLPDDEADELLNFSYWELEDKFPFEAKETTFTTTLVEDDFDIDISGITDLDAIVSVSWVDDNGQSHKLDRMSRDVFDDLFDDESVNDVSGQPERYLRENVTLFIWPPPGSEEAGQILRIALKESLVSLVGIADKTLFPRNWDEIVLTGAIERGHFLNQDYDLADKVLNRKLSYIRSTVPTVSKEERDSRHAGLDVYWGD